MKDSAGKDVSADATRLILFRGTTRGEISGHWESTLNELSHFTDVLAPGVGESLTLLQMPCIFIGIGAGAIRARQHITQAPGAFRLIVADCIPLPCAQSGDASDTIDIPITALSSSDAKDRDAADMATWASATSAGFEMRLLPMGNQPAWKFAELFFQHLHEAGFIYGPDDQAERFTRYY